MYLELSFFVGLVVSLPGVGGVVLSAMVVSK
jgi:hypothetical protein